MVVFVYSLFSSIRAPFPLQQNHAPIAQTRQSGQHSARRQNHGCRRPEADVRQNGADRDAGAEHAPGGRVRLPEVHGGPRALRGRSRGGQVQPEVGGGPPGRQSVLPGEEL
uniref:(northern house mosquito) hypothetical protein n=1 Tax=Culex pipiens TaxID=7175 RepID=A0A8D8CJ40_CULPI